MRLDVDSMSYEQLLALEEQMGNVSTGLSEDAIVATLKHWKYRPVVDDGSDNEDEPCCICQEAYAAEDDLGKLKCGHGFHFNCIKRWLVEKNSCPICKKMKLWMFEISSFGHGQLFSVICRQDLPLTTELLSITKISEFMRYLGVSCFTFVLWSGPQKHGRTHSGY
ncbi:hypothetical protein OIU76_024623 [Salix suchowensis]|nr:hypothetical protein OIU76_024623 [Salix suchowensis]